MHSENCLYYNPDTLLHPYELAVYTQDLPTLLVTVLFRDLKSANRTNNVVRVILALLPSRAIYLDI